MKKKIVLMMLLVMCTIGAFAQKYKFGKVSKEELKETFYPTDSTAEAAFLYKSKYISFSYNTQEHRFEKTEDIYVRIKIYNKDGFKYGNQRIVYYNPKNGRDDRIFRIKATTYNLENGKIKEQDVNKKEIYTEEKNKYYSFKKIPFPNLKNGSIIELKYTLISQYWDIPVIRLQEDIPTKKLKHVTSIPEYFKFKKATKGYYSVTPKIESSRGSILFSSTNRSSNGAGGINQYTVDYQEEITTIEDENIPALKNDEPFTSNYGDYRGIISMELAMVRFPDGYMKQYSTSWESVCSVLHDSYSFGKQLNKKGYFSKDLQAVIAGKNSETEKIEAIYDFVKSKMKWNEYYGISTKKGLPKAYKEGVGNVCEVNLILVAMLREAGINAHPILISTKNNGVPLFPTLEGLNYVIVGVKNGVDISLLDASEKYNAINVLPARDLNWSGRMLVNRKVNVPVSLVPKKASEEYYMANVSFDDKFKVSGSVKGKLTNRKARSFRMKFNKFNKEKLKSKLGSKYHVNVESCEVKNKKELSKPIYISANVSSTNYCETINGKKYINPLLFFKETKNPFKLEKRKYPVDLVAPYKEIKSIVITIPNGYRVVSLPKSLKAGMSNNLGSYSYLIQQVGNTINVKTTKQFNTHMVGIDKYHELKDLYKNMVAKNKEKIVLEKIDAVASAH
ncbi:transglutaminase domain-containing protein [Wenyingzhuangia sp. IMCC45574]